MDEGSPLMPETQDAVEHGGKIWFRPHSTRDGTVFARLDKAGRCVHFEAVQSAC